MAKAGYCSKCGQNVWLASDGSCAKGHGPECISGVYDTVPPTTAAQGVALTVPVTTATAAVKKPAIYKRKWFLPVAMAFLGLLVGTALASPSGTSDTKASSSGADAKAASRIEALEANVAALTAERDALKTKLEPFETAAAEKAAQDAAAAKAEADAAAAQAAQEAAAAAQAAQEAAAAQAAQDAAAAQAAAVAAAAAKPTTTKTTATRSETVYITESGAKYHRDGCQYLSHSQISISLANAKAQGYTACSRCF